MLENRRLDFDRLEHFDSGVNKRAQIDTIQFLTLSRMIPTSTASIPVRIALRLEENFFRKPLHAKLRFFYYAVAWGASQIRDRLRAVVRNPTRYQSPEHALRVAIHGTGSIGDFLTHILFIQTFYKTYGPMEIDFFCHENKIEEAKFIFANTPFIKNVITINVLNMLKQDYDLLISLRYLVKYEIINHSRILELNSELFNVIEKAKKRFEPYEYVFDQHPTLDGLFARHTGLQGMNLADVTGYLGCIDVVTCH